MSKAIHPARGMRDFLPDDKAKREKALATLRRVYAAYGFCEIETPALEDLSRLKGSGGGENLSMIFEVMKRGLNPDEAIVPSEAADLGLRYDLTLPLTRYYASHAGEWPGEWRSLQIGPVWRAERPQKGRFRQFTQCDIDIIGVAEPRAEVELIVVTLAALAALQVGDVTVRINDRRLLRTWLTSLNYTPAELDTALIAIDKLDKIGLSGVEATLTERFPGHEGNRPLIDTLAACQLTDCQDAAAVAALFAEPICNESMADATWIMAEVKRVLPNARLLLDPTLVRGMGYYTGPIFEVSHDGVNSSIAGGGRYDGMVGHFLGRDVPACGFSIGFERIIDLMPTTDPRAEQRLLLMVEPEAAVSQVLALQNELAAQGWQTCYRLASKKNSKTIQQLASTGYTRLAWVNTATKTVADLDIKPICDT